MHPLVKHLQRELKKAADPEKAGPMQAYLKTTQSFYGVPTPARRAILGDALNKYSIDSFDEYAQVIRELWRGKYREEMHLAIDIAGKMKKYRSDAAWPLYEEMLRSATNWDLVDGIAISLIGDLVLMNRKHEARLREWLDSDNFWMRRSALLAHLKHKEKTNVKLLASSIKHLMHEKEFFIRKAIGWVLREYAYTDPDWVRKFVAANEEHLSGLSKREALKHLS